MRQFLLSILFIFTLTELYPQVLLNEFSSSNLTTLSDEDGAYSDWIEIYNHSSLELNLEGYHLSDDAAFLKKWTFPAVILKPEAYIFIFASGKNRTAIPVTYKTLIDRGDEWQFLVPGSDQGESWKNTGFDASTWSTGKSGFGYGDNDDSTVLSNITSVFIRKEFTISDIQNITELVFSIDYDDGFVAYINGHEIARNNVGYASPVPYNYTTGSLIREATMYQGGFPDSYTIKNPATFLVEGVNVIAVQGHNSDAASSDFSLIPMLSIGRSTSMSKDSVPSYIQLKGTRLHTNFRIKDEGETLILSKPDSSVVDSISPVILMADYSYGRQPNGSGTWFYFQTPTPGEPNSTRGYATISSDTVIFSSKGGYYPGGVTVQLSSIHSSDSIFYTTDGSEPTVNSIRYTAPLTLTGNSIIRARSVKAALIPGPVASNTYITTKHTLPVVCISTDPSNLWDYNTGIYAMGPGAAADPPYFGANFWQDWERKAHMEFYDVAGEKKIDQDIGLKIFGSWSRAFPEKSLALYARKMYGKGAFEYKFFRDKQIDKFESLILRNSGNDWEGGFVRDGLTSTLINDMDLEHQAFEPSVVYINGEYWGILDMREKVNSNFLAENNLVNPDRVNLLEIWGNPIEGSNSSYMQIVDYLNNNTLETDSKYNEVARKIDVNNYIKYQLTEIYINNKDWPGNNIKFWNTSDPGSLWRWIVYDTDFGFSIWEENAYTFNTLQFALETNGPDWPNPPWATLFFRRMASNPGFRAQFATQFLDRLNRNFSADKVTSTVDSLKQVYLPEIRDHLTRWDLSFDNWSYNYDIIRGFGRYRPDYIRTYLRSQFDLGQPLTIKVEINDPGTGIVQVNSIIPYKFPFNGIYFKDLPIKLTAIPSVGYKFSKWIIGNLTSNSAVLDYDMAGARNFVAVFEQAKSTEIKIVINEINYNSSPSKDTKDWIELYNAGVTTVNLKGWTVSDGGAETGYEFPSDLLLTPGMYVVVCRNLAAFREFCPSITGSTGDMGFGLSSSGDNVNLYDPDKNLVDFVNYSATSPWPVIADGSGATIELTDPLSDNNDGKNWKASANGGTPGKVNYNFSQSDTTGNDDLKSCRISCFPNPFSDYTTMMIEIAKAGRYKIEIYDTQGKLVTLISDQTLEAGEYFIDWYGKSTYGSPLPGGVYIVRLSGENQYTNTKVIILK